ncbi:MAG: endolytic transglycosylase MltG, partial [Actinobacteria bacterium]
MARRTAERRLRGLSTFDRYPRRPMDTSTPHAPTDASGRPGRRRRRVRLVVVLVAFLLVTGAVSAAVAKYRGCQEPPAATGSAVAFPIPPGATGKDVVAALDQRGLIRCGGFVGNLLLRGTGKAGKILAGTYDLRVGMSLDEIVSVITTPPPKVPTVRLTVPEGLRISTTYPGERSISSVVAGQTGLSAKTFASLADSGRYRLPPFLPRSAGTAEGFLFPDTYQLVKKGLTADTVIRRMLMQFQTEAK